MNEPEIPDPYCNPDSPVVLTFDEITSAAYRIKSAIKCTECTKSEHLTNLTGMEIYIKKEFLLPTGSFKERGTRNFMLKMPPELKSKGIVAASAGNHALACCYHGLKLGIPITVVMPVTAPIMKITKCKNYKGNVMVQGQNLTESKNIAMDYSSDHGMMYLNGYDHPDVLAGQGTIGLEIWEQVPGLDAVLVPIGDGGLLAGICVAIKTLDPNIKVIGVEVETGASMTEALKIGKPVEVKLESTLADGLAVAKIGVNSFASVENRLDKCVMVNEQYVALAILRLVELEKSVVEGAGATVLAAILQGLMPELKGKKVCLILSGGNIDTTVLGRALDRGLAADGRLVKVKVCISDRVGGIEDLANTIGALGVHIKDIVHERAWVVEDVFKVEVKVVCECRDREHSLSLKEALATKFGSIFFNGQLYPNNDIARSTSIHAGPTPQQKSVKHNVADFEVGTNKGNVTDFEVVSNKGNVSAGTSNISTQIGVGTKRPPQQGVRSLSTPGSYSIYMKLDATNASQAGPAAVSNHTSLQAGVQVGQTNPQTGSQIVSSHPSQQATEQVSQYPSNIPQMVDQKTSHIDLSKRFSNCSCKKRNAPGDYQK